MSRLATLVLTTLALQIPLAAAAQRLAQPLATYTDATNHVSFDYPSSWTRRSAKNSQPPFDYCQPAVFGTGAHDVPIHAAVQFTGEHGPYANSELSSLVFIYGIRRHTTAFACHDIAANISEAKSIAVPIRGQTFTYARGGECGLSHGVDAKVYTTFRRNACYVFEKDFYTANFDGARHLGLSQIRALDHLLDSIMLSVRFEP